jgi:D-3-phosphoglycerate dehydrogenase
MLFIDQHQPDALIIGTDPLTANVLSAAKKLKAIGKYGVGLDKIDLAAVKARGIFFGFKAGVNRRSVSELTLAFMLGHQRNIFKGISRMQEGRWVKDGGSQLSAKTIGIVGFGHIGTDLAHLLKPFQCNILVNDILDKTDQARALGATQVSYKELLISSDVISFHVPGGSETKNMFGDAQVKLVKPTAFIINTARGSVVDFDATSKAVREHRLGGYASDVFPTEPFLSQDYLVEDGFYFSPHIGGNATEAVLDMGQAAIEALKQYLEQ